MKTKVFGIGLSKTGTSSLAEALNRLGIRTIHYPDDAQTYSELQSGIFDLTLLKHYDGVADTPVVPYYAQLDAIFPGSKFILTIREKNAWLASVEQHWRTASTYTNEPLKRAFQQFIRTAVYGCVEFNKARFSYVYDLHYNNVLQYFAARPADLLVIDICAGEGWAPLCSFLQKPVPDEPFPHANEWMTKLIRATKTFQSVISPESTTILIDDQLLGPGFVQGHKCLPFTARNGVYNGAPVDGVTGADELKQMIAANDVSHIVVAWPSFWWLDQYPEIRDFLDRNCNIAVATEELVCYKTS